MTRPTALPTDPVLRRALPPAAVARDADDPVGQEVWREVARCLEGTSAAVACTLDGTDPSVCAVLASCALAETSRASALLAAEQPGGQLRRTWPPVSVPDGPVEITWGRLVELLLRDEPVDPVEVAGALEQHRTALVSWRRVLLGPVRVRRERHGSARPV